VCGIDVAEEPLQIKKKIGYLPELNALYYDMFVREYLGFISDVHKVKNRKAEIEKVIKTAGLTVEANKKIGQLSKGYKQRVGLAAALIHDPEVLILDEPTTGLDPNQIIEIREVIKMQGKDKTVLFSSHILQEVEAICDRVLIINKGILVADDKLSNLQQGNREDYYVIVQFKEFIKTDILRKIKYVKQAEETQPGSFRLQTENPEIVRKQILEIALQQNLNIISLQSESQSLESIFKTLTKN
jgi:ABC-2 type transport system ATP-binding protein